MTGSPCSGSAAITCTSGRASRSAPAGAHQRAAGAEARDERVDAAVEVLEDLGARACGSARRGLAGFAYWNGM